MKTPNVHKKPGVLNENQKRFVIEYLRDLNATQAAIRAGYKGKGVHVQALRLLQNATIQKYICQEFDKVNQRAEVKVEDVLLVLKEMAYCDLLDAYNEDGTFKRLQDMPRGVRRNIASIEVDEIWDWEETTRGRRVRTQIGQTKKIKFWPKDRGVEMLGKYLAMFVERNRFEDPEGKPLPAVQVNVINVKPGDALPKAEGLRADVTSSAPA